LHLRRGAVRTRETMLCGRGCSRLRWQRRGLEGGRRDCSTNTYTDRVPCYALRNATRRCNGSRDLRAVCRDSTPVRPHPAARSARAAEGHPRQPPPPRTPTKACGCCCRGQHRTMSMRSAPTHPRPLPAPAACATRAALLQTKHCARTPPTGPQFCRPRCLRCHRRLHRPTCGTRACRTCPHPNHVILFRRPF
jgi:hypothetical protein